MLREPAPEEPDAIAAPPPWWAQGPRSAVTSVLLAVLPVAVLIVLWLPAGAWDARTANSKAALTTLSSLSALAGTVLLSVAVVLTARARLLEQAVGGLDRLYRLHHWLGGVAFMLIAAHPVALAWRNAMKSWSRAGSLWRPSADDRPLAAGQAALYLMGTALVVTVFLRLRHEVFLWVQRLLGIAFVLGALHAVGMGGTADSFRPLRWYLYAVLAVGAAALAAHSLLGRVTVRHHHYRLRAITPLPAGIDDVRLTPRGHPMAFVAGQFAFLRFRHGGIAGEPHPFSMASAPSDPELRFVVKELGDYTRHLREVTADAEAIVEGPYGGFSYRLVAGRDQIWVAGGIGVAPFLSMAADLPPSGYRIELFYCYPDEAAAPFLDELDALDCATGPLRIQRSCDRTDGVLTADAIAARCGGLDGREFLLCGPPAMMHALRDQLRAHGVEQRRIHFEEFVF